VSRIPKPSTNPCHDKERFATYAEADRQAWYAMARRRNADANFMLAAYFCARCSGWHIANPRDEQSTGGSPGRWSSSLA
jgi:hypothetical protein